MTRIVVNDRVTLVTAEEERRESGERVGHSATFQSGPNRIPVDISEEVYRQFAASWPLPGRLVLEFDE